MWGEEDRNTTLNQLKSYKRIATMEEHLLSGGFGAYLLELGLNIQPFHLKSDVCGEVGQQSFLKNSNGLNRLSIIDQILESKFKNV